MGTLTEKINYLKQTKQYIKEAIISKGQSVSSSDTFRSYASKIENITTESALESKIIRQNGYYYPNGGYDGFSDVDVGIGQIGETYEAENTTNNIYQVNDKVWLNYRQMLIQNSSLNNSLAAGNNAGWDTLGFICDNTSSNLYYNDLNGTGQHYDLINNIKSAEGSYYITGSQGARLTHIEDNIPVSIIVASLPTGYKTTKVTNSGLETYNNIQLGYGYYIYGSGNSYQSLRLYFPDGTGTDIYGINSGIIWKHLNETYFASRIDYSFKIYSLNTQEHTLTLLSSNSNVNPGTGSIGLTSDKKHIVSFTFEETKTYSTHITKLDYSNNSCSAIDVTNVVLPSSIQAKLTNECVSYFNPINDTLIISTKSLNNINQISICKYNKNTEMFEDISAEINLPSSSISNTTGEYNIWLSNDYRILVYAAVNKDIHFLNIYYMDNAEGWVITNYNNINQDSITGFASEVMTPGTIGNVIVGIPIGSDSGAYSSKLTLQGVVDGLPQPTEEEIIEDSLEILTNI